MFTLRIGARAAGRAGLGGAALRTPLAGRALPLASGAAAPAAAALGLLRFGAPLGGAAPGGRRFKSTIGSEIEAIGEKAADTVHHAADAVAQAAEVLSPDQIGHFQSLGLAQSWMSFAGFFQHVFEYVHVYTGLPWWATILSTTVALRLLMLPLYISASDSGAKMARIKPELTKLVETTKKTSDQQEIQKAMIARRQLMKENNVKISNMLKPVAAIPIFLGVFGALTGMSNAPVAAMATEGLFWFKDLTAADPYVGLQIITACFYAITFKVFGGETGAATVSPVMKKVMTYMPFVAVPLTMSLPASVCFYFAINAVFSIIQSNLLKQPAFRRWLQIAPMVSPEEQKKIDAEVARTQSDSIVGAVRQKFRDAKDQAERKMAEEERKKRADADRAQQENSQYVRITPRANRNGRDNN